MAAGAGAFMVAGPVGAFAAGVSTGALIDTAYTASTGENHGLYQNLNRIANDDHKAAAIFDTLGGLVADGLTGHAGGKLVQKIKVEANQSKSKFSINSFKLTRNLIFVIIFLQFLVSSLKHEANVLQENAFDNAQQMTTKAYQTQMNLAQAKFNYATHLEG